MSNRFLPLAIYSFLILSLLSCSKEGPAGPAGPAGPTGPTGPQGVAGNANVRSTEVTINPSDWVWNSTNYVYYKDVPFTQITADVMNLGFVMGYMKGTSNGSSIWQSMPLTFYPTVGSNTSYTYEISYISVGSCRLRFLWSDSRQSAPSTAQTFRLVAVSGTGKSMYQNTDWTNVAEVEKILQANAIPK